MVRRIAYVHVSRADHHGQRINMAATSMTTGRERMRTEEAAGGDEDEDHLNQPRVTRLMSPRRKGTHPTRNDLTRPSGQSVREYKSEGKYE